MRCSFFCTHGYRNDEAGNLVSKGNKYSINGDTITFTSTSGVGVEYYQYEYNLQNRLAKVRKNGKLIAEFSYDADGMRIKASETLQETNSEQTTYYVYGYALNKLDDNNTLIEGQIIWAPEAILNEGELFYRLNWDGNVKVAPDAFVSSTIAGAVALKVGGLKVITGAASSAYAATDKAFENGYYYLSDKLSKLQNVIGDKKDNLINGIKYYKYAKSATKNPGSDSVVLGKHSQTGHSYDKVAIQKGATYFNLDNWNSVCNKIGKSNMWKINQKFLEQQISQEKNFLLARRVYSCLHTDMDKFFSTLIYLILSGSIVMIKLTILLRNLKK